MSTKKAFLGLAGAAVVAGLVWSTSNVGAVPTNARPGKSKLALGESGSLPASTSAACPDGAGPCCHPCNYFEDYENVLHFSPLVGIPPGNILGQGDPVDPAGKFDRWTVSVAAGASKTSLVSIANPFGGIGQHLRMSYDSTLPTSTTLGAVVSARVPASAVAVANTVPVTINTIEVDIAIGTGLDFLADSEFNMQPQAVSQGFLTTRSMFFYNGSLYVLDDTGAGCCTFISWGTWDTSGAYGHLTVTTNPCNDTATYEYRDGTGTVTGTYLAVNEGPVGSGLYGGTMNDQVLFFTDNFAGTDTYDVENLRITRDPLPCPAVCGDGTITNPEQCDGALDTNCPGRCQADCSCAPLCGGLPGDPCGACSFENDVHFTGISTGGWFTWTASAPAYAFETCGVVNYDSQLSVWGGADCNSLVLIEQNDDCDDNTFGFGDNADPLASCYAIGGIAPPYQSCLCIPTTVGTQYWVWDDRADALGRSIDLLASKRADCGALWGEFGACCDTNGADQGCTDNVAAANCVGPDKRFTLNKSCGSAEAGACDCIALCNPPACGDDGCGGSCGTCDDGNACTTDACTAGACVFTPVVCNDNIACTSDACVGGSCQYTPNNALCEDSLFCTGAETCNPASGCVSAGNPCDPTLEICNEATDACDPAAIPTVSEWGLAIMSLLLLVGLKVYFGRREALA